MIDPKAEASGTRGLTTVSQESSRLSSLERGGVQFCGGGDFEVDILYLVYSRVFTVTTDLL